MNLIAAIASIALIAGLSSAQPATSPAIAVQPTASPTQTITASPTATLANVEPTVSTTPAPAPTVAPAQAPVAPVYVYVAPVPTQPTVAPVVPAQPVCEEDMPCWDCSTMGNLICGAASPDALASCPADFYLFAGGECVDPYSHNVLQDCAAQGMLTAEDYSCVPSTFYDSAATA